MQTNKNNLTAYLQLVMFTPQQFDLAYIIFLQGKSAIIISHVSQLFKISKEKYTATHKGKGFCMDITSQQEMKD